VCSGKLFTVDADGNLVDHGGYGGTWVSFGENNDKELFVVDIGGDVYRIIDEELIGTSDFDVETFNISPNPATDIATLTFNNGSIQAVRVMNLTGSVIFSEENIDTQRYELNVSQLRSGLYLVSVQTASGVQLVNKLVIR